jgi:hypothetical protein
MGRTRTEESERNMKATLIEYIEHYLGIGWVPIPLHDVHSGYCSCSKAANCGSGGKHPRVYQSDAKAADRQTWQEWIKNWPNMNLAVLTGSAYGFFVVDIDPRHGGDTNFAEFCKSHGLPPKTLEAQSGGGGRHLFFKIHGDQPIKTDVNVLGYGIDIRGDGGIIVVEPSVTQGAYKWL